MAVDAVFRRKHGITRQQFQREGGAKRRHAVTRAGRATRQKSRAAIGGAGDDRHVGRQSELSCGVAVDRGNGRACRYNGGKACAPESRVVDPRRPCPRHRVVAGLQRVVLVGDVESTRTTAPRSNPPDGARVVHRGQWHVRAATCGRGRPSRAARRHRRPLSLHRWRCPSDMEAGPAGTPSASTPTMVPEVPSTATALTRTPDRSSRERAARVASHQTCESCRIRPASCAGRDMGRTRHGSHAQHVVHGGDPHARRAHVHAEHHVNDHAISAPVHSPADHQGIPRMCKHHVATICV